MRQCAHDRLVEAMNQALALIGDQRYFTRQARLEAHGRSRRNVETIPEGSPSIEGESRIGLGEMIMAADLNRPVARVGDDESDGGSVLVQDDLARCWKNLARYHVCLRPHHRIPSELDRERRRAWCRRETSLQLASRGSSRRRRP